jgi:hypothetical protein
MKINILMKPTLNDKIIAYLALISGLAISGVAEYYSIMGLIAIYPAAFWPVIILGIVLGVGKISATVWLKQNWDWSPFFLKAYVLPAIFILMMITSLGVFGFLSKAHSDQSLVSGDVQAKIAVYDEKIKIAKDNIDANRKAIKQLDEAVDQVMGRSNDEKGAEKSVAIRRSQQKERARLQEEISTYQKTVSSLSEERAPIAAEVRKVEAEVGPIKYIAHLLYGENPDINILEKAVIWVTVLIVIVLDPLAIVLLLSSQYSFQRFREVKEESNKPDAWVSDVGEQPTAEEKKSINDFVEQPQEYIPDEEGDSPLGPEPVVDDQEPTVTESNTPNEPVKEKYVKWPGGQEPLFCNKCNTELVNAPGIGLFCPNKSCDVLDGPFADKSETEITIIPPAPITAPTPIKNSSNIRSQVKVFRPVTHEEITEEVVQQNLEEPTLPKTDERTYSSSNYVTVNGQTYRQGAIPVKVEKSVDPTYVQNEEQKQSNLWSATTGNTREFFETEKTKKE